MRAIPEEYVTVVQAEREALWLLVSRARAAGESGGRAALRGIAAEIRRRIARGDDLTIGNLQPHLDDITAQLDLIFDASFPPPSPATFSLHTTSHPPTPRPDSSVTAAELSEVTGLLDVPWPTARRRALLARALGRDSPYRIRLDELADLAIGSGDFSLLRVLVFTPLGHLSRDSTGRVLRSLHAAGRLEAAVVEQAVTDDRYLGHILAEQPGDEFAGSLRHHLDALTWRLVTADSPPDWSDLPKVPVPRGLRFVLLALDWAGDPRIAGHLGAADLSPDEQPDLVRRLKSRSRSEQQSAYGWRGADAPEFLPVFGLERAAPLLRLMRAMPPHDAFRVDRAAVLAAVHRAGLATTRRLLELEPNELVSAVLGDNRPAVLKRLRNNALQGIAAFGLLPLPPGSPAPRSEPSPTGTPPPSAAEPAPASTTNSDPERDPSPAPRAEREPEPGPTTVTGVRSGTEGGETVLDRYLVLRESGRKGARLGPGRKVSHAAAVAVALDHLAQVAGFAGVDHLEWDCEARLAERAPGSARIGDYRVVLEFDGADPVLRIDRGGRGLRSVPAVVRADPGYKQLRERQEQLRDQARRMRAGLVEQLVATGGTLTSDELGRLLSLPAGAALLPALLWRGVDGVVGLLGEVDTTGPVTAVHPVELHAADTLTGWQAKIVRQGREQPVKQVFREIYVPARAESQSPVSARFSGRRVDGKVAGQLLSGRGWRIHGPYDDYQVTHPTGAALTCDFHGYFGMGEVTVGVLRFLRDGITIPIREVPPVVFSERIRDLDLMVSAAAPREP